MGSVHARGPGRFILSYASPTGRRFRPTIRAASKTEAERVLKQREGALAHGRPQFTHADTLTFDALAKDFITDYEVNGRRSVEKAKWIVQKLAEVFRGWKAVNITTPAIRTYIERRQREGFKNATINRDLAALKRMFRLAVDAKLLSHDHLPRIELLKEAPPRSGFFEWEAFQLVLRHLPARIKPIALLAYELGWRLREVLGLQWHQINLDEGWVRLAPGTTKNDEGRVAYLSPDLLTTLRAQHAMTRELEHTAALIVPWCFHRNGRRIGGFRKVWDKACRQAGAPGMVFHDLRRTAIRNMVRAGIPERVAMQISGHKTRSIFERYNVTSEADLKDAAKKIGAHHQLNCKPVMQRPQTDSEQLDGRRDR
jgi:integrase